MCNRRSKIEGRGGGKTTKDKTVRRLNIFELPIYNIILKPNLGL